MMLGVVEPILWFRGSTQHPCSRWVCSRRRLDGLRAESLTLLTAPVITGCCNMLDLVATCCSNQTPTPPAVTESPGLCQLTYIRIWREKKPLDPPRLHQPPHCSLPSAPYSAERLHRIRRFNLTSSLAANTQTCSYMDCYWIRTQTTEAPFLAWRSSG
jgi:hypothetical protein